MVAALGEHEGHPSLARRAKAGRPSLRRRGAGCRRARTTSHRHHPPGSDERTAMADETYTGEFYCVKCKEKREATGNVVETNGRRMAKGKCPVCGTNLNRILGKA
ncbi:hypothetical protein GCM10025868_37540 [Angustibacter aerolatus]|uniref:DUF5679 domain-containing protein n=1 Tax=Angustibacter aerolatus TaxID=1162965 RepID=A0ABQ6JN12_9ACTN|nr:hypothetical protein GCM10025868_37540 [Angustibacter aerolatus]